MTRLTRTGLVSALALSGAAMIALAGCGREADRASRPEAAFDTAAAVTPERNASAPLRQDVRTEPVVRYGDGKPMWAPSRQRSGQENAERQFQKHGSEFAAGSVQDYVAKAHSFVTDPPRGAERLKRGNGDVLVYDARSNVLAIATRDGAPRALFKPRDGQQYWADLKQQAAAGDDPSSRRRTRASGDEDANG
jgi:hypothetical protein